MNGPDRAGVPDGDRVDLIAAEERLRVDTVTEQAGRVGIRKQVDHDHVEQAVPRGVEHAEVERTTEVDAQADSGQVETLPDGSLSIPVFEEQLVVTKRLVVRERIIVRKHTVVEEHVVSADLARERIEVDTDGGVEVVDVPGTGAAGARDDRR